MLKLFVRSLPSPEGIFLLDRDLKKRLIKVMRLRQGDHLQVFTSGKHWECELAQVLPNGVELRIIQELPVTAIPKLHLTLGQAIPKGDRFDWLIQKATELGVTEIFPLITERTIVHPSNLDTKLQRWNEIADHAAGQSKNIFPTMIHPPATLPEFVSQLRNGLRLLLHERHHARPLREVLTSYDGNHITFVVGPEGGWSDAETAALQNAGFQNVHLGTRILRSETAGLVLAAVLEYEFGDF